MTWSEWLGNEHRLAAFAALALVILGNSLGNILLKLGALAASNPTATMIGPVAWQTLAGIVSFAGGVLAYAWALKHFELHAAQIVVSLQYVCVILLSHFVLGENIAANEWIGIVLIGSGLFICAR